MAHHMPTLLELASDSTCTHLHRALTPVCASVALCVVLRALTVVAAQCSLAAVEKAGAEVGGAYSWVLEKSFLAFLL